MNLKEEILEKYIAGQCSPAEAVLVEKWFSEIKSNETISNSELEALITELDRKTWPINTAKINWTKFFAAASIIAILIAFTTIYFKVQNQITTKYYSDIESITYPENNAIFYREGSDDLISISDLSINQTHSTEFGEIKRISSNEFSFTAKNVTNNPRSVSFETRHAGFAKIYLKKDLLSM